MRCSRLCESITTSSAWRRFVLGVIALSCLLAPALWPPDVGAHASLDRAEPPIDGLVIAAPSQLRLFFTEDVSPTNPAPTIEVLDEAGNAQAVSNIAVGATGDQRQLTADIEGLDAGTYTVIWSVRSATDGHILSGTYAFRVGGGMPPGIASTEGEIPEPWAVALRWLTFAGIAIAGAGFFFRRVIVPETDQASPFGRRRSHVVVIGALVALVASLAEPLLQTLFPPQNVDLNFDAALAGLPTAWWFRPICMGITIILGLALVSPLRTRLPATTDVIGGSVSVLALAGLSLTSHAAGRETWREMAIAVDFLHQVSTALWVGGLSLLVLWWHSRDPGWESTPLVLKRFSRTALLLFGVALVSGLVNTGFVLPITAGLTEFGFTTDAFSPLWASNYGIVLLIKLLVLVLPFGLAIYHRQVIGRLIAQSTVITRQSVGRLGQTLRLEVLTVMAVVLGGSTMALSAPPLLETAALDTVILTAPTYTADDSLTHLMHLTIDPARPGDNEFSLRLTTPMGEPLSTEPEIRIALEFRSLDHDTVTYDQELELIDAATTTYATTGLKLSLDGWWQITATIRRQGFADTTATSFLLLPDPNTQGFDAPPAPETAPEAQAVFDRGLATMTSWTSVRLRERIVTGSDALVISERAITSGANGQPPAQEVIGLFAGGFGLRSDGEFPPAPQQNFIHSVTIGDRGWQVQEDGAWLETPVSRAEPPAEWGDMYAGAKHIRLGATDEINGEEVQIISFHTPDQPTQSEAWFTWWVGVDSGNVYRVTMVANRHYMITDYTAINDPFVIEGPPADAGPQAGRA